MAALFNSTTILFSLLLVGVIAGADETLSVEHIPSQNNDAFSALKVDFEQLQNKIHLLETHLDESNIKLKAKDEKILQLENVIQKSDTVASLQAEIDDIQVSNYDFDLFN